MKRDMHFRLVLVHDLVSTVVDAFDSFSVSVAYDVMDYPVLLGGRQESQASSTHKVWTVSYRI